MTENKVTVNEDKFNGVVSLTLTGATDRDTAERVARQYFRDEYGHSPSKVVAQPTEYTYNQNEWEVMVADHSSGSLKDSRRYEW